MIMKATNQVHMLWTFFCVNRKGTMNPIAHDDYKKNLF